MNRQRKKKKQRSGKRRVLGMGKKNKRLRGVSIDSRREKETTGLRKKSVTVKKERGRTLKREKTINPEAGGGGSPPGREGDVLGRGGKKKRFHEGGKRLASIPKRKGGVLVSMDRIEVLRRTW